MAGLTDTYEQAVLDHIFTDPAWSPPATLYLGLSSTTPTEAGGNITEPSGGSYARVSTVAADWSAASGTAPASKTNTAAKTFPTASADWASGSPLTHVVLMDASTVGNCIAWAPLAVSKTILNGDTAQFAASSLVFKAGDPGDSY